MAGKVGVKKTIGKTRKGDTTRSVMRLTYVQKPNGAYAPRYEPAPPPATPEQAEQTSS